MNSKLLIGSCGATLPFLSEHEVCMGSSQCVCGPTAAGSSCRYCFFCTVQTRQRWQWDVRNVGVGSPAACGRCLQRDPDPACLALTKLRTCHLQQVPGAPLKTWQWGSGAVAELFHIPQHSMQLVLQRWHTSHPLALTVQIPKDFSKHVEDVTEAEASAEMQGSKGEGENWARMCCLVSSLPINAARTAHPPTLITPRTPILTTRTCEPCWGGCPQRCLVLHPVRHAGASSNMPTLTCSTLVRSGNQRRCPHGHGGVVSASSRGAEHFCRARAPYGSAC